MGKASYCQSSQNCYVDPKTTSSAWCQSPPSSFCVFQSLIFLRPRWGRMQCRGKGSLFSKKWCDFFKDVRQSFTAPDERLWFLIWEFSASKARGNCHKGSACKFAHGAAALRAKPDTNSSGVHCACWVDHYYVADGIWILSGFSHMGLDLA